jgi:hypothetical protein
VLGQTAEAVVAEDARTSSDAFAPTTMTSAGRMLPITDATKPYSTVPELAFT